MEALQFRELSVVRDAIDLEKRTIRLSFSSDRPYLNKEDKSDFLAWEILSHEAGAIDTERLSKGLVPVLIDHDRTRQVGAVTDYQVTEGKAYAIVRISRSETGTTLLNDVADGIRTGVSVGYRVTARKSDGQRDGYPVQIATHWMPMEVSFVSIPADSTVGVGRGMELEKPAEVSAGTTVLIRETKKLMAENVQTVEPETKVEVKETVDPNKIRTDEVARIRELTNLGKKYNAETEAEDYINRSKTVASFREFILNSDKIATRATTETRIIDPNLGMKPKEQKQYNLCRAILNKANGHLDGFEWECHREIEEKLRNTNITAQGFFVPEYALVDRSQIQALETRDLSATGGPATGGSFIMTEVVPSLIPLLRNKTVAGRMGARLMGGLTNNLNIPRQTGAAVATWNTEIAPLTESDQAIDHVVLTPNRLGGWTNFSKQLLQQSVIDVQTFVREDLLAIIYLAQDKAALAGTGSGQPTGILTTPADTVYPSAYSKTSPSITFGSGYPTWSNVVAFEGNVESNNIDCADPTVGYVTTPTVKALWKTLAKTDPRSSSYFPSFFWGDGSNAIGDSGGSSNFGEVNGYKALASKQVPNDLVIFGKWQELLIGMWGGIDLVVDPYVLAQQAEIRVIINIWTDIELRYGPAFCYSTNSGLMH